MKKIVTIFILTVLFIGVKAQEVGTPWTKLMDVIYDSYYNSPDAITDPLSTFELKEVEKKLSEAFGVKWTVDDNILTHGFQDFYGREYWSDYSSADIYGRAMVGDVLCSIIQAKYKGKKGEKYDYYRIRYSPHYTDYERFLNQYPQSEYRDEMRAKMTALKTYQLWFQSKDGSDLSKAYAVGLAAISTEGYEGFEYLKDQIGFHSQAYEVLNSESDDVCEQITDLYINSYGNVTRSNLILSMLDSAYEKCRDAKRKRLLAEFDNDREKMSWIAICKYMDAVDGVPGAAALTDSIWNANPLPWRVEAPCSIVDSAILIMENYGKNGIFTITVATLSEKRTNVIDLTLKPGELIMTKVPTGRYETIVSAEGKVISIDLTDIYNCVYCYRYCNIPLSDIALPPSERERKQIDLETAEAHAKSIQRTVGLESLKSFIILEESPFIIADGLFFNPECESCTEDNGAVWLASKERYFPSDHKSANDEALQLYKSIAAANLGIRFCISKEDYFYMTNQEYVIEEEESTSETNEGIIDDGIVEEIDLEGCYSIEFSAAFVREYVDNITKKVVNK